MRNFWYKFKTFVDERPVAAWLRISGAVIITGVVLTACGVQKAQEPFEDAGRGRTFSENADTVTMPDGFSNLATKCGPGGMRYTVAFHGDSPYGSIAVTPDPSCR